MFNPNSSIPIGAKVGIGPRAFTLGVKVEIERMFSICAPKLLINAELYGLVLTPRVLLGTPLGNTLGFYGAYWEPDENFKGTKEK